MTDESNDPTTPREFDEALSALIRSAHENDVEVEGGWDVADDGTTTWAVEITRVSPGD
jgi:hypothetical protein